MRSHEAESKDDGLVRWDFFPNPDPRLVCSTCYDFNAEKRTCLNEEKKFFFQTDRRIFDPNNMRCISHKLHHDFTMFMKSEFKDINIEDFKQRINDTRNELSRLEDFETIKKQYGSLLRDNPFENKDDQVKHITEEIDLSIDFKWRSMRSASAGVVLFIDAATLEKVNQTTLWIKGFKRDDTFLNIHHSFTNQNNERFVIKRNQVKSIDLIKNGQYIKATIQDFLVLMNQPNLLDQAIKIDKINQRIAREIFSHLQNFHFALGYHFTWNKSFGLSFGNTFNDLPTFKQVFHCLQKDGKIDYVKIDFLISGKDNERIVAFINIPTSCGDFSRLMKELDTILKKSFPEYNILVKDELE